MGFLWGFYGVFGAFLGMNELRDLDVALVCEMLGFQPDPDDSRQFKSDGFRISVSGQKWFDHEAQKGGGGAIDLVMHINKLSYVKATQYLSASHDVVNRSGLTRLHPSRQKKPTYAPAVARHNITAIKKYLVETRGINADLVQWCIDRDLIYADTRSNCCFRYGDNAVELRGTGQRQWRAVYGCPDKPFLLPTSVAKRDGVAVLESAIDALSYRQLHVDKVTMSIAGNGNHNLINWVVSWSRHYSLPIYSAFDSDNGGDTANKILIDVADAAGVKVIQNRPTTKDWNDFLMGKNATQ
jgi:hypothetical protein